MPGSKTYIVASQKRSELITLGLPIVVIHLEGGDVRCKSVVGLIHEFLILLELVHQPQSCTN